MHLFRPVREMQLWDSFGPCVARIGSPPFPEALSILILRCPKGRLPLVWAPGIQGTRERDPGMACWAEAETLSG